MYLCIMENKPGKDGIPLKVELDKDWSAIHKEIEEYFNTYTPPDRKITIFTFEGGLKLFNEAMKEQFKNKFGEFK
jgi:hypothetical protein